MNKYKSEIKKETNNSSKPKKTKKKKDKSEGFLISVRNFIVNDKFHRVLGIFFILLSFFLLLSFISYFFTWKQDQSIVENLKTWFAENLADRRHITNVMGLLGAVSSNWMIKQTFGITAFFFVLLTFICGIKLFLKKSILPIGKTFIYSFIGIIWISVASGFIAYTTGNSDLTNFAGDLGFRINLWLEQIVGKPGTFLVLLLTLLTFLVITYNFSIRLKKRLVEAVPQVDEDGFTVLNNDEIPFLKDSPQTPDLSPQTSEIKDEEKTDYEQVLETESPDTKPETFDDVELTIEKPAEELPEEEADLALEPKLRNHFSVDTLFDPRLELSDYKFPSPDLLEDYGSGEGKVEKEELNANKDRIVATLKNYGITIEKIKATIGPTVTLYELVPAAGVRISKIKGLEDDIAMSLSALGIRIIAPMPGKGTIGIEVPNKHPEIVSMKSILSSERFQNSKFELPIAIGKTISDESYILNLAKLPHILMAGATGQGKSVGLNAILTSLLYKKHPSEIKFVLVDPKKVELTLYEKIERHYLAKLPDSEEAIITDTRKVVRTLNSLCIEMDNRFNLLKDAQVRNVGEYNEKFITRKLNPNNGHHYLPYIVLVVDEFADLIMTAGKEVETPLTRLAQLSRAIGIHLIIATQRPTVNIITGTIKANFPCRIAFRVVSKIDSRTVLDTNGADQLVGRGDMLLATGSDIIRLQCAFIDIHELERLTSFIGEQRAYPDAYHLPEYYEEEDKIAEDIDPSERDEFFEQAAHIIVQSQHGSTSLIQRKLKLGYNRAGRIIDQLEAAGIIGPFEGSKARDVRIKDEIGLEQLLQRLRNSDQ
jgi:DNA segregation ATPase FtsK/SpoIIIE, S-DNA-T family